MRIKHDARLRVRPVRHLIEWRFHSIRSTLHMVSFFDTTAVQTCPSGAGTQLVANL